MGSEQKARRTWATQWSGCEWRRPLLDTFVLPLLLGYVLGKMWFKNRYLCEGGGAKRGESSLLVGLELPPSSRDIIGGINQLCMGRRRLVG